MYAAYHALKNALDPLQDNFVAVTVPWKRLSIVVDGSQTMPPEQGVILFWHDRMTADVVSHEMTHAALDYLEELDGADWACLKDDDRLEERMCYVQGWLTGEFWEKWGQWRRRQARKERLG